MIVFSSGYSYKGCNEAALALSPFLTDIGIDENIRTKLLQSQKQALESRVETLYDISHKDEMTGLFNRRYYESVIAELRERESIENIVVAEMDLNGLKAANDNIGHKAGDELIVAADQAMYQCKAAYYTASGNDRRHSNR